MKITKRSLLYINLGLTGLLILFIFFSFEFNTKSTDKIVSILGLIITTISFLVACYFLVVAVSVYSKINDIEKVRMSIDKTANDLSEIFIKVNENKAIILKMLKNMTKLMDDFISQQIYFIDEGSLPAICTEDLRSIIENRRNSLIRKRSLMALTNPFMSGKRRCDLIREIAAVAKKQDIELLEHHSQNESEKRDVIDTIKEVIKMIKHTSRSTP